MARYRRNASRKVEPNATIRWRNLLFQGVPFTGNILRNLALDSLFKRAQAGDPYAACSLAECIASDLPIGIREKAAALFEGLNWQPARDAAWRVWMDTRNPLIEEVLNKANLPAAHPVEVRTFSQLKLGQVQNAGHPSSIPFVIKALEDGDPSISTRALRILSSLRSQLAINEVFNQWAASRSSTLTKIIAEAGYIPGQQAACRVIAGIKFSHPEWFSLDNPETVQALISACSDNDRLIADGARQLLTCLTGALAIDALCLVWSQSRSQSLEQIIQSAGYIAQSPVESRYLSALMNNRLEIPQNAGEVDLPILIRAARDTHKRISENAGIALQRLSCQSSQSALAEYAVNQDDLTILSIVLKAGSLPEAPDRQALFLFLTGQFERYDIFDFDLRLMRAVYETSPESIRKRISRAIQLAGNPHYLPILNGINSRFGTGLNTLDESAAVIKILAAHQEWNKLWDLVFELPLSQGIQILQLLNHAGWISQSEHDRLLLESIRPVLDLPMMVDRNALQESLPAAFLRAKIRTNGRINAIAFSPAEPLLAVGSASGKIILWDYKKGEIQAALHNPHGIGQLEFTKAGILVSTERSVNSQECHISRWEGQSPVQIGSHQGSVTSLSVVDGCCVTTGRDSRVAVWDILTSRKINEQALSDWPRSAAFSHPANKMIVLDQSFSILNYPELSSLRYYSRPGRSSIHPGVKRCAAFSPTGEEVIVGQHNGQVIQYSELGKETGARRQLVANLANDVVAVRFLPGQPYFILAESGGEIQIRGWPALEVIKRLEVPTRLTSLDLSGDGAFFAVGTNQAELTLWDLRVLKLPDLMQAPLGKITAGQFAEILSFLEPSLIETTQLPTPVRNTLKLLRTLLQYRYRYDINVEELPVLRAGEFDILIEG